MKTLFLFIMLFGAKYLSACSCLAVPFCQTAFQKSEDLVISGVIVDNNTNSIRIKVIDVLRGSEDRDTINVWDGTDFDCNGLFSMKSIDLGNPGDSILIILPKIVNIENTWDVIGDYRRPEYLCYFTSLLIKNDTIAGPLNTQFPGSSLPGYIKIKYDDFITYWNNNDGDCTALSGIHENFIENDLQFIQNRTSMTILSRGHVAYDCELLATNGAVIKKLKFNNEVSIDLTLPPGIYILRLRNDKGAMFSKKIFIPN